MTDILCINLNPRITECVLCGKEISHIYCLPMYESEVVPDNWEGEWGGFTVCKSCYFIHRPDNHWDHLVQKVKQKGGS